MKKRLKKNLYFKEKLKWDAKNKSFYIITNENGTLFSGKYPTKIYESDLPEWFVYGRYYKRFGYMSTKGIIDLVYIPSALSNHFLKDDYLLVSYKDKIILHNDIVPFYGGKHSDFSYLVSGPEILNILRGAKLYSNFDIRPIVTQIKGQMKRLKEKYPDEFSPEVWSFDIDKYML